MATATEVQVVRVVDGDTVVVADAQSLNFKVRLFGIDAPECGMPYGPQARAFLAQLVLGRMVQMDTRGRDRYGRTVGTLSVDGQDVGLALLRAGWAWHDRRFSAGGAAVVSTNYPTAQRSAQGKAEGLWTDPASVAPWRWRAEGTRPGRGMKCQTITTAWIRP